MDLPLAHTGRFREFDEGKDLPSEPMNNNENRVLSAVFGRFARFGACVSAPRSQREQENFSDRKCSKPRDNAKCLDAETSVAGVAMGRERSILARLADGRAALRSMVGRAFATAASQRQHIHADGAKQRHLAFAEDAEYPYIRTDC